MTAGARVLLIVQFVCFAQKLILHAASRGCLLSLRILVIVKLMINKDSKIFNIFIKM